MRWNKIWAKKVAQTKCFKTKADIPVDWSIDIDFLSFIFYLFETAELACYDITNDRANLTNESMYIVCSRFVYFCCYYFMDIVMKSCVWHILFVSIVLFDFVFDWIFFSGFRRIFYMFNWLTAHTNKSKTNLIALIYINVFVRNKE